MDDNNSLSTESVNAAPVRPRIAILVPSLTGGGAEKVAVNLANAFSELKLDVTLIVVTSKGDYWRLVNSSVRLVALDYKLAVLGLWRITRTIRHLSPDVVISTLQSTNVVLTVAKRMLPHRTKVVIREANIYRKPTTVVGRIYELLQRIAYRHADSFVANSSDTLASFRASRIALPPDSIVLPNPIYTPKLQALGAARANHRWLIGREGILIVSIGRLVEQKGFDVLLNAVTHLASKGAKVQCIVLGTGPLRATLERQAEQNGISELVDFVGFKKNPYPFLARADVFVLPSRWEGFGNVIVEALALNIPVIATDCVGAPSEILMHGKWGTLVPVDDAKALAKAIEGPWIGPPEVDLTVRARDFDVHGVAWQYLRELKLADS